MTTIGDDRGPSYLFLRLMGRCRDGAERDSGTRFHAVRVGCWSAICGAKPGKRSAGWSSHQGTEPTCPLCRDQLGLERVK
jgi:hypothetical protein